MKNYYLSALVTFWISVGFAQNPEIKNEMPTVIPPSPTVAALMKFEEIPVSNYTGTPDISIPIFATSTLSKGINLDISLKYHTAGVAVNERASDVGLGWSLFAGGSISRTVRGLPDEIYNSQGILSQGKGKLGIYQDNAFYPNNFNEVVGLYFDESTAMSNEVLNKYLWNAAERGVYDTEYDLWQFNFMGQSGQFTIRKNTSTNLLEIRNQDIKSNLKIINTYDPVTFKPLGFTVYDDLGYKYIFDIVEKTTTNSTTTTKTRFDIESSTASEDVEFNSAFHLSGIYDNNNKLIMQFQYINDFEIVLDNSLTVNDIHPLSKILIDNLLLTFSENSLGPIDPNFTSSISQRRVNSKKISHISVEGKAKIDFNYQTFRQDTNLHHPEESFLLKSVEIRDWNNNAVKKAELMHYYSSVIDARLMLQQVKFSNGTTKVEKYELEYFENSNAYGSNAIKADLWGYFKIPNFVSDSGREVNPSFCTTDLLQKMTLPTGGSIIFDFEANTYSSIRDVAVTDFDDNPRNWDEQILATTFYPADNTNNRYVITGKKDFFTLTDKQDVLVKASFLTTQGEYFGQYIFNVFKMVNNVAVPISQTGFVCVDCEAYPEVVLNGLEPGVYRVSLTSMDGNVRSVFSSATITAYFKDRNENNYKFLYGGGNRIKQIGYFDTNVEKDIFHTFSTIKPAKKKVYNYSFFANSVKSSGSLVIDKPIYEYDYSSTYYIWADGLGYICPVFFDLFDFMFTRRTDYNNIKAVKTSGSDVGYQNVAVKEEGNGEVHYTYTSPIDAPDSPAMVATYPFEMPFSKDYERGLLKKEETFDKSGKILSETTFQYSFEEEPYEQSLYGLSVGFLGGNSPFSHLFANYDEYKYTYNFLKLHGPTSTGPCCPSHIICSDYYNDIKLPREYIDIQMKYSPNGWAKLTAKTTKNYFYPTASSPANVAQTDETYSYNTINKRISEATTTTSQGEVQKTKYFYHTGNATGHQNRISEIERIESYMGPDLLSTSKIEYSNTFSGNASYLPAFIKTSKGSDGLENRIRYNKYDEYGHPTEVQQENGILTSYIWGYNMSQPVAKIDNLAYASIPGATITDIQAKTNTANNETNVLAALNALRTSFPNAQITTYTYIPLVGVSTITDPKGDMISYTYDEFLRLKEARDKENKILSENQYNYRTQN